MGKENQKKINYPEPIIEVFIFNENNQLFLMKSPKWLSKYTGVRGRIELGEGLDEAAVRKAKEEANLDISNLEFIRAVNSKDFGGKYQKDVSHLILDYQAKAENIKKIKLDQEESSYKWLKIDDWLKKDRESFAPCVFETLERLKNKLEDNFKEKYKRALADYQNLLKQTAREKQNFIKYANEQLILEIIPIFDNLKISLKHFDREKSADSWLEGIKHIVKQFRNMLENFGVEEIEAEGKKFNPENMEALEGKGEKVKQEVRPGYKLHGKVIIPAKVILDKK